MTPGRHPIAAPRKLLLISYHFPPDALIGGVRTAKFAKYLDRLGWKPYILTVKEKYAPLLDRSKLAAVSHLPVVRTAVWPTVLQLALKCKPARRTDGRTAPSPVSAGHALDARVLARLKRYANSLFELPDKQVGWLIPALFKAYWLVRTERIELVMTSSPPRTTALVGLLLSYLVRVRLVTDLRDPWYVPHLQEAWFRSLPEVATSRSVLGDRIEQWLERKIFERSARIIVTTERHAVALRKAYRTLPDDRFCAIANGYDAEDLAAVPGADRAPTFTISYLGTLYLHRSPRSVLQALSELIRDGQLSPSDVTVNLIGDVRSTLDGSVEHLIASFGLIGCVRIHAAVSYSEALRRMMQSDLLLLFAPNQHCSIPAKAFEYLATRKPVLCLAQDGATADLINSTKAGFVVDPEDVGAIKTALVRVVDAYKSGQPLTNGSDVSMYERSVLSQRLSDLLGEVLHPSPSLEHTAATPGMDAIAGAPDCPR